MPPLELSWHFDARHHLYQWYGRVQIVGRHAVGQWFCVDLDSGRCLWERRLPRANTIRAIADGVIVASEMRSDGPWTADFGVYAIALESGELLWTSHREGLAGTVCKLLDHVPGFTNERRDRPNRVHDGEVLCESGRVLDLRSGRLLRRVPVEPTKSTPVAPPPPPAPGELTVAGPTPEEHHRFVMSSARDGHEAWRFDIKETGHFIDGSPRSWRADGERIYLVRLRRADDGPNKTGEPVHRAQSCPTVPALGSGRGDRGGP